MNKKRVAIVGTGPAGLMAATQLSISSPQSEIHLFEKRPGFGRKLLIAGSSGLNISHKLTESEFADHYSGFSSGRWRELFSQFSPKDWIDFIQKSLELETFLGTSQRYFVRDLKSSNLLRKWIDFLQTKGVVLHNNMALVDFESNSKGIELKFDRETDWKHFAEATFFLGGGSWEDAEPSWCELLRSKGITITPLIASNVGYEVDWKKAFLEESEGDPLKKVLLKTSRASKIGELVITRYGLEGTPIYFCGTPGEALLDLKPDLSEQQIFSKLDSIRENLSPIRRMKHHLGLSEAAQSLVFHHAPVAALKDLKALCHVLKNFPIRLKDPRPLKEAISSAGGVALNEISESFELKKFPHIYCGGEMLDWDAPTGGFLIQACVTQGAIIGREIARSKSV